MENNIKQANLTQKRASKIHVFCGIGSKILKARSTICHVCKTKIQNRQDNSGLKDQKPDLTERGKSINRRNEKIDNPGNKRGSSVKSQTLRITH